MSPPTRLFLIRHGQSAGNAEGVLASMGRRRCRTGKQAEMTANMLARRASTPYIRRSASFGQTAEPLAELLDLGLRRRLSPTPRRRARGLTFDESKAVSTRLYAPSTAPITSLPRAKATQFAQAITELHDVIEIIRPARRDIFAHRGDLLSDAAPVGAIHRDQDDTLIITSNCGINRFELRG